MVRGYVPARRSVVTVTDATGAPQADARVAFGIYNYGEYYPVASYQTDSKGQSALDMGCGDMVVWASKGDRFGLSVLGSEAGTVVLDHAVGDRFGLNLDIVPPAENPLPSGATPEEVAANAERFKQEDVIRETEVMLSLKRWNACVILSGRL